jgi:hypothetical protein
LVYEVWFPPYFYCIIGATWIGLLVQKNGFLEGAISDVALWMNQTTQSLCLAQLIVDTLTQGHITSEIISTLINGIVRRSLFCDHG